VVNLIGGVLQLEISKIRMVVLGSAVWVRT
jgi:hypothetical protein